MKIYKIHRKGNFHLSHNRLCDDSYYQLQLNEHLYLLAIADGCSSSKFGSIAADAITKEIGLCFTQANLSDYVEPEDDNLVGMTTEDLIEECFNKDNSDSIKRLIKNIADNAIARYKNLIGAPFYEFSTTLIVCLVDKQNNRIICISIGDGFAGAVCKDEFSVLANPHNVDNDPRRTYFVTDPDAVENMDVAFFDGEFNRLILTTDGLSKLYNEKQYDELFLSLCVSTDYDLYRSLIKPYEGGIEFYSNLGDDITLLICEWHINAEIDTEIKENRDDCFVDEEASHEEDSITERDQKISRRKAKRRKHHLIRFIMRSINSIKWINKYQPKYITKTCREVSCDTSRGSLQDRTNGKHKGRHVSKTVG